MILQNPKHTKIYLNKNHPSTLFSEADIVPSFLNKNIKRYLVFRDCATLMYEELLHLYDYKVRCCIQILIFKTSIILINFEVFQFLAMKSNAEINIFLCKTFWLSVRTAAGSTARTELLVQRVT